MATYDQFDQLIKEQEETLKSPEQQRKEFLDSLTSSLAYKIEEKSVECPALELNTIYQKLRLRL